jgi:hypothetical protein
VLSPKYSMAGFTVSGNRFCRCSRPAEMRGSSGPFSSCQPHMSPLVSFCLPSSINSSLHLSRWDHLAVDLKLKTGEYFLPFLLTNQTPRRKSRLPILRLPLRGTRANRSGKAGLPSLPRDTPFHACAWEFFASPTLPVPLHHSSTHLTVATDVEPTSHNVNQDDGHQD